MVYTANLGFPRIGSGRELKKATESFWKGDLTEEQLRAEARRLRAANWQLQRQNGVDFIPSNDFSLYDQVLDTSVMVGAIPEIYGWNGGPVSLETYFAMARGTRGRAEGDLPALEMTKWFDTNYHYLVPEFTQEQSFTLASTKPVDEFLEAQALGLQTRPVLLGPVSYLLLGKCVGEDFDPLTLLPRLLPVYGEVLRRLAEAGADWVQLDEPCLALDLTETTQAALKQAYSYLAEASGSLKVMLTSYFGGLGDNLETTLQLPVSGVHLDLVRAPDQLDRVLSSAPGHLTLSLGVVDGRNVWRSDLESILERIAPVVEARGADRLVIAPSCSLLHVPIDLELETELDPDLKSWLAFAVQKVEEVSVLGRALNEGRAAVTAPLESSERAVEARRTSPKIHDAAVETRLQCITRDMARRTSDHAERRVVQQQNLKLPDFPTTTIGSFPQTEEIRKARAAFTKGRMSSADYQSFLKRETEAAVRRQEEIGLDVLVHGEFERNDMVQYFGEQLSGFAFTRHGWVQSFGTRYVRPPILYGDVSRPAPMTVEMTAYAQSLTERPVKGMLTGPVTLLQWSFVRDDQPRERTCRQIALALRDEVADLEQAGIRVIQIDEPAFREGLPLRRAHWRRYLDWAVECFRLAASVVSDETQIHTHMCYSEFNDIMDAIAAMDADVISIETARSKMELLEAFTTFRYPNEIGPGVYDIHAPRCPEAREMTELLREASKRLDARQIWVNPDCGLKTRSWEEVSPALANMVAAARDLRAQAA
ncbi:5-methyltetrahydropteroyltriglutamate--homocysteine S-methyltransferase [Fodinicurvata sediminis]|uniref:5-methyltetrahydropteroyltriglutamate-- homocysteine S-methyltransferase n=1 Tax=Fodinicurvata sediminis TaxID=1121832 RepID=UPI0003B6EB3C|nr:5-methyltetrahydropteroyltriglutamate--homocysteine S-methyltransferase [Fodinicurvata sediminis]